MTTKERLVLNHDLSLLESMLNSLDPKPDKNDDYIIEELEPSKICEILARSEVKKQKNNDIPHYNYRTIKIQSQQDDSIALNTWLFKNDSREEK